MLELLKELRDYVHLILGFALGTLGSFITSNPKIHNWFSGQAKIFAHSHEYTVIGGIVNNIRFHYEIINGYVEPLIYYTMLLEFNTKDIRGNSLGATSLTEVIDISAGKWYLLDGETHVGHRSKSNVVVTQTALLSQITNRENLKYRLCVATTRYGTIKSSWKELPIRTAS